MFLRSTKRKKNGKEHRYWSVVENQRVGSGRSVQRTVLYLGEINDSQQAQWCRAIETLDEGGERQTYLFPEDRESPGELDGQALHLRLNELELSRPRQFGGCWLALQLWDWLEFDRFWAPRLKPSRKGTDWLRVLKVLTAYRLLDPGSEWRLHREWFTRSAMAELLGGDARLGAKNTLYRCHDKLLAHRDEFFSFLRGRWEHLFEATFDVVLYDVTSTYFESDPAGLPKGGIRQFGYSRDKRSDCVQVLVAMVVDPDGLPLGYRVWPGNRLDHQTLKEVLEWTDKLHGTRRRVWVMDRGVPTEATLEWMREHDTAYLVGTPKGRLTRYEQKFLEKPWEEVRGDMRVKLLEDDGEHYVLARSQSREAKERGMRLRRLRKLRDTLVFIDSQIERGTINRDKLLMKLGGAKKAAGRAYGLFTIEVPKEDGKLSEFSWSVNREKWRKARRKEGRYLLRTNQLSGTGPELWEQYIRLVRIEESFRNLKGDLGMRPLYHQNEDRIEAHIFICFLAYCLHVALEKRMKPKAPGLTPRSMISQLSGIQMLDVTIPATDGNILKMRRHTKPDKSQALCLAQLGWNLPPQPPPEIKAVVKT